MTNLPPPQSDFLHKTIKQVVWFFLICYEKVNGKFADINCSNEIFWGHLGVQKGLKKGKLTKKIITFSKKQKYNTAYSYNGLEIVSQILTGLKQGSGMLFLLGHIPLRGHKRDKSAKLPLNNKYTPYSV